MNYRPRHLTIIRQQVSETKRQYFVFCLSADDFAMIMIRPIILLSCPVDHNRVRSHSYNVDVMYYKLHANTGYIHLFVTFEQKKITFQARTIVI